VAGRGGNVRFAYFAVDPAISTVAEVTELNDSTRGLDEPVSGAAPEWDGASDPVRSQF
jgi:hypothetical protein